MMFWYIFRIKPLSRLVENRIRQLICECDKMTECRKIYPEDSFGYARVSLGIELWELKIEAWKAVIGGKNEKI